MQIVVNGRLHGLAELASGSSLAEVVAALELKGDRVAVELNGAIVRRPDWPATPVGEGAKLEVVHFVGGGAPGCNRPASRRGSRPLRLLAAAALLLAVPAAMLGETSYPTTNLGPTSKPTFVLSQFKPGVDLKIVAYGDTRFTDGKNTDDTAPRPRRFLVNAVVDEAPDAVFFSGDLPFHGSDPLDWDVYRQETARWKAAQLRVFPTLGNHEFKLDAYNGLKYYFENFPYIEKNRWYSVQMGNVYLIALDSIWMPHPGNIQQSWLDNQLLHIPPTVDFVFFLLHMPLVTDIQTQVLVGLPDRMEVALRDCIEAASKKSRAKFVVVSGHIHNYERFERNGVSYIVTGGGGAEPYPVLVRGPQDLYRQPGFPNFHYLVIQVHGKRADFTMKRIADPEADNMKLEVKETFTLMAK